MIRSILCVLALCALMVGCTNSATTPPKDTSKKMETPAEPKKGPGGKDLN